MDELIKAGKIATEVVDYAKSIIKPGKKLKDIAEEIDSKIIELGAKPAFPVNLSINEIAAHSTPSWDDETKAFGLLKVDIGVHLDGFCADTAFSVDLDNDEENKKLIESAEFALKKAVEIINKNIELEKIGEIIEKSVKEKGFTPIVNLSGHNIEEYELHAGITIPNFKNGNKNLLGEGTFAIEPFATNGLGKVRDGKPSGIFHLQREGNVRDAFSREVLYFIADEYRTLPFCSRWIYNQFGTRGLLALRHIKQAGLIYEYPQLVESGKGKVAQAEHTVLINKDDKIITTEL